MSTFVKIFRNRKKLKIHLVVFFTHCQKILENISLKASPSSFSFFDSIILESIQSPVKLMLSPILEGRSTSGAAGGAAGIQFHCWEAPTSSCSLSHRADVWLMWKSHCRRHPHQNNNNSNDNNNSSVYSAFLNTQRGIYAVGAHTHTHTHQ